LVLSKPFGITTAVTLQGNATPQLHWNHALAGMQLLVPPAGPCQAYLLLQCQQLRLRTLPGCPLLLKLTAQVLNSALPAATSIPWRRQQQQQQQQQVPGLVSWHAML
jgi:hypothetical protein